MLPKTRLQSTLGDVSPANTFEKDFRHYLRSLGQMEDIQLYHQDWNEFLKEQGMQEIGRGAEGAVYILRGHVIKLYGAGQSQAATREIFHMLHLNPKESRDSSPGERIRQDWPTLLWVYVLSNGALAIGMKPFDRQEKLVGATLQRRLQIGPLMNRDQVLKMLSSISASLMYAHERGIIHHDIKPGNIYIPGNPDIAPVVFDLGQALWKNPAWGNNWKQHKHNLEFLYNGTYRYMNWERRLALNGARALVGGYRMTSAQAQRLGTYNPGFNDDVFSFARVIREITRSRWCELLDRDRSALEAFSRGMMGLPPERIKPKKGVTVLFTRIKKLVAGTDTAIMRKDQSPAGSKMDSMLTVRPRLDELIQSLRLQAPGL